MSNLEWALRYYHAGWLIFPCLNKKPHFQALAPWGGGWKWINRFSLTEEIVKKWWHEFPGAQIALICGQESGVTVLDIDWLKLPGTNQPDMEKSVDPSLLEEEFPSPLVSITGGRGRHVFFRYASVPNSAKSVHPQIDVRSEGGYVILPPSIHSNGAKYQWCEDSFWSKEALKNLPDFPTQVIGLTNSGKPVSTRNWREVIHGASEGARNQTTASLAGLLLKKLDPYLSWEILGLWNEHRNQPPLSPGELSATFTSILKREYAKRSRHGKSN